MAADRLSLTFSALAHPARRAILTRLSAGQTSVRELAAPLNISAPAMTKHLKSLERGGLISRSRNAQWRPCRLESQTILEVTGWVEEIRSMTERRLDRLETYLEAIQADDGKLEASDVQPQGKKS